MKRLYQELEAYGKSDYYPFHMPGHKRNNDTVDGVFPFAQDITEIYGFDNLHHPEEILLQAQKEAATLYGVQESFYSINGSTAALLSAISAAVKKGGKLLTARNCHKAVYHAMYLRELEPVYLYPPMEKRHGINGGILPEDVENTLKEQKDIQAVLVTSPTYDGVVSNIGKIAEIVHRAGIPLIVDEAHGAHFHFHSYFPVSAAECGADLVIQSFHKTLPSMTQTAILHRCSDRIDRDLLMRFLGIYQTSSPSYVLMASMDACIHRLQNQSEVMYEQYTKNLQEARKRIRACKVLHLVTDEIVGEKGIFDYDRSKILISTVDAGMNGGELSSLLREKYHLEMEMDAEHYVTALTSVGDTREGFDRLCEALLEIDTELQLLAAGDNLRLKVMPSADGRGESKNTVNGIDLDMAGLSMEQVMKISEAMDAETEICEFEKSEGKISAEFAYFYPPGIPVITPGERITGQFLKNVRRYIDHGFLLQGLSDYKNVTLKTVKEK